MLEVNLNEVYGFFFMDICGYFLKMVKLQYFIRFVQLQIIIYEE